MKRTPILVAILLGAWCFGVIDGAHAQVVDTGQVACYDDTGAIQCPRPGEPFYGQDAQYQGLQPAYVDNGDSTVTDLASGLMWTRADSGMAMHWEEALEYASNLDLYVRLVRDASDAGLIFADGFESGDTSAW
jgi:hypothetical protein